MSKVKKSGDHTGGENLLPIPNRAGNPPRADDTASARAWESRSSPGLKNLTNLY